MIWQSLLGHKAIIEAFQQRFAAGHLASTYLLVGPEGIGKRTFAHGLAEALLCRNRAKDQLLACGTCPSCAQVQSGNHPDVLTVQRPRDKNVLPLELFVGDREHRSEEGLCRDIRMRPQFGSRRVAIIDDADYLNEESGNALLKTLEEPPPGAIILLIGTSSHRQLRTILSRCQVVSFEPLTPNQLVQILGRHPDWDLPEDCEQLALAARGSLQIARHLTEPAFADIRELWLQQLATGDPGADDFGRSIVKFTEAAGKDSAAKKERLYFLGDEGIEFYSQLLRHFSGQTPTGDQLLLDAVARAADSWQAPLDRIADAIHRLCDFQSHVEANAHPANATEALLFDLHRLSQGYPEPIRQR